MSPRETIASTFDVVQFGSVQFIAVACRTQKEKAFHNLFHCTFDVSKDGVTFKSMGADASIDAKGSSGQRI